MNEQLGEIERVFLAFADKTRLQLLHLLREDEVSVNALCEVLNTSQPKVSRHLAYLRTMNMVTTRREGKCIYYKLNIPSNPFGASIVEETIEWIDSFSGSGRQTKPQRPTLTRAPISQPPLTYEPPDKAELRTNSEPEYVEEEMEVYLL